MYRRLCLLPLTALLLLGCPSGGAPADGAGEGSATSEAAAPEETSAAEADEADAAEAGVAEAVEPEAGTQEAAQEQSGSGDPRALQLQRPQLQLAPGRVRAPAGGLQIQRRGAGMPQPAAQPRLQLRNDAGN